MWQAESYIRKNILRMTDEEMKIMDGEIQEDAMKLQAQQAAEAAQGVPPEGEQQA